MVKKTVVFSVEKELVDKFDSLIKYKKRTQALKDLMLEAISKLEKKAA